MSYSHRIQRRKQQRRTRQLRIAAVLLGLTVVGVIVAVLRSGDDAPAAGSGTGARTKGATSGLPTVGKPATGAPMTVLTPEGYYYTLAGVRLGTSTEFTPDASAVPGKSYAYVEYLMTNSGKQQALLDFPPNVFMRRTRVPDSAKSRCGHRAGKSQELCDLPSHTRVVGVVAGSKGPVKDDTGATYIPPGASYLVRSVMDFPVGGNVRPDDLALYVQDVRYTGDRIPRKVYFP